MAEFSDYKQILHMLENKGKSIAGESFKRVYYFMHKNMGGYWVDAWAAFYGKKEDDLYQMYKLGYDSRGWFQHVTLLMEDGIVTEHGKYLVKHIKENKQRYEDDHSSINPFGSSNEK